MQSGPTRSSSGSRPRYKNEHGFPCSFFAGMIAGVLLHIKNRPFVPLRHAPCVKNKRPLLVSQALPCVPWNMYPHLFVLAQRDGGTRQRKALHPYRLLPQTLPLKGGETVAERGYLSNLNCCRSGRQQISICQGGTTFCALHKVPTVSAMRFRDGITACFRPNLWQ